MSRTDPFDSIDEASSLHSREAGELIARARDGCDVSLNELIRSLQGYLLVIARHELNADLRAKVGASDIVQSVLIRAEQNLDEFRGSSRQTLLAWLRKILTHEIIAVHRKYIQSEKRNVQREVSLPAHDEDGEPIAERGLSPLGKAVYNENAMRLREAVERLPMDYQTVVYLRNWEKLPFEEIGQRMQRSADAVKKLWKRAIQQLERELGDEFTPSG
ncbi:MAG: sigma-70 family RNA polymerase sigma factor [Planctomycetales bacterium]|nr:sigma-70 family RNA polymerase sigma factor [Planctomycetales bacterium]